MGKRCPHKNCTIENLQRLTTEIRIKDGQLEDIYNGHPLHMYYQFKCDDCGAQYTVHAGQRTPRWMQAYIDLIYK